MSRSIYIFIVFAPPAARVPPSKVIAINDHPGHLPAAKTIVGTVVTSNNSMILGLVKAIYPPTIVLGERLDSCENNREGTTGRTFSVTRQAYDA
jgi:hypothetical protein